MIKRITNSWGVMRLLRLLMGGVILVQGILQKESLSWIAGFLLVLSAVFNYGCCGSGACPVPPAGKRTDSKPDYEEIEALK